MRTGLSWELFYVDGLLLNAGNLEDVKKKLRKRERVWNIEAYE